MSSTDLTTLPPPRTKRRPGEPLWEVMKGTERWSCWLRYHGEWGVEAQIFENHQLRIGRRFLTRAEAVLWSESERDA